VAAIWQWRRRENGVNRRKSQYQKINGVMPKMAVKTIQSMAKAGENNMKKRNHLISKRGESGNG